MIIVQTEYNIVYLQIDILVMTKSLQIPNDIKIINGISIILLIVFLSLTLVTLIFKFLITDALPLKGVSIRGDILHQNPSILRENIISKFNGNFYTINLIDAKNVIESLPWVNKALIKRVYPQQIEIRLMEHRAVAIWGIREDAKMVNEFGAIFETEVSDDISENMPQFIGSSGTSELILNMYRQLILIFDPMNFKLVKLELSQRGGWFATFEGGASIQFGRGTIDVISDRAKKFARTLELVSTRFEKNPNEFSYADLRHPDGYALRINGVGTVDHSDSKLLIKK